MQFKKRKKIGRPKKRGPKKKRNRKKNIKIVKKRPVFDYKIVSTLNGKQNGYIGTYMSYEDAFLKLKTLEKENDNVVFPRKYLNKENITLLKDEYLLLEKNRFGDKKNNLLRNEFGKYIEHKIINNNKWVIKNKIIRKVEETFWVYGYDPKTERKTFEWIFNEKIINSLKNIYDIIRIFIYKNKLIIRYDNSNISLILCKNKSDCIRMYNLIEEKINIIKNKQVFCIGSYDKISSSRKELEKEIADLTGWNKIKIQRATT